MQLNKYIRFFPPLGYYQESYTQEFITRLGAYKKFEKHNPIPDDQYKHIIWEHPLNKSLKADHYILIYYIAKFCKVKMMWRAKVNEFNSSISQSLWIIGYEYRIHICHHILTTIFKVQGEYDAYIRIHKRKDFEASDFKSIKVYSNVLLNNQRNDIYLYIKDNLEFNPAKELHLESYIKERYKLDYKKYNTDHHEYYHAISVKFHHRRMLL